MKKQIDPRMHTTEHLLNQTMVRMFNCGRCFEAHIERKRSRCYFHFDRELTQDEVAEVQSRITSAIESNLPVTESYLPREEAEQLYNTDKLPDDLESDRIRIVHIGNYDACPCIGEHVLSTKDIGTFNITTTSFEDGVLKIRFR
jgi:misacylated tRNA(Ala) deacylase